MTCRWQDIRPIGCRREPEAKGDGAGCKGWGNTGATAWRVRETRLPGQADASGFDGNQIREEGPPHRIENIKRTCYPARMNQQATSLDLSRKGAQARPALPFLGALRLDCARVHEFCGPSRRTLALMAARSVAGPVLWISPGWLPDRLNPQGVVAFIQPGRLVFVQPRRAEDLLWVMEEALRSAALALVVAELPEPPGLTPVRRLHLAAEAGALLGPPAVGLVLTPGDGGAAGVESRWHLAPAHASGLTRWRLERRRARMEPPKTWELRQSAEGLRLLGA